MDNREKAIRLDQFLKRQGLADTGGHAKVLIQGGEIHVNSEVETRRGRQLHPGDVVEFDGVQYHLAALPEEADAFRDDDD